MIVKSPNADLKCTGTFNKPGESVWYIKPRGKTEMKTQLLILGGKSSENWACYITVALGTRAKKQVTKMMSQSLQTKYWIFKPNLHGKSVPGIQRQDEGQQEKSRVTVRSIRQESTWGSTTEKYKKKETAKTVLTRAIHIIKALFNQLYDKLNVTTLYVILTYVTVVEEDNIFKTIDKRSKTHLYKYTVREGRVGKNKTVLFKMSGMTQALHQQRGITLVSIFDMERQEYLFVSILKGDK